MWRNFLEVVYNGYFGEWLVITYISTLYAVWSWMKFIYEGDDFVPRKTKNINQELRETERSRRGNQTAVDGKRMGPKIWKVPCFCKWSEIRYWLKTAIICNCHTYCSSGKQYRLNMMQRNSLYTTTRMMRSWHLALGRNMPPYNIWDTLEHSLGFLNIIRWVREDNIILNWIKHSLTTPAIHTRWCERNTAE